MKKKTSNSILRHSVPSKRMTKDKLVTIRLLKREERKYHFVIIKRRKETKIRKKNLIRGHEIIRKDAGILIMATLSYKKKKLYK
jgi:hypothetical protein